MNGTLHKIAKNNFPSREGQGNPNNIPGVDGMELNHKITFLNEYMKWSILSESSIFPEALALFKDLCRYGRNTQICQLQGRGTQNPHCFTETKYFFDSFV